MEMTLSYNIDQPADKVWEVIADFGDLSWLTVSESSGEGVGMVRLVHWGHAQEPFVERLEAIDHAAMSLHYTADPGRSLPTSSLEVHNQVVPIDARRCCLKISMQFNAAAGSYEEDLKKIFALAAASLPTRLQEHLAAGDGRR